MKLVKAPEPYSSEKIPTIFLAGSIEGDTAANWQEEITAALSSEDVLILNPRRDSWDATWKQEITNPQFKEQVDWELDGLDHSDLAVMYFDKNTKSPISLLELGLYAASGKMVVCCPEGFWRKGNVDVVCARYNVPQVDNLKSLIDYVKNKLK